MAKRTDGASPEHEAFKIGNAVTAGDLLDAIHAVLENQATILENQALQAEQYAEIIEKLTNINLERDDWRERY